MWKRHPSTGDFTNFQMHSLTPVAKAWYNFLCVKIKPTLYLSIVTKDRTILIYAMTKGFQFDIGSVIERGLIESTQGRCTGALIHPSLITQLCHLVKVLMLDSKGQVQQRLPIPLPKAKFGSSGDLDEETYDDAAAATPSGLLHGLKHIGMSLRNTVFPKVRTCTPSGPRWPSFAPARTISRSIWLSLSFHTLSPPPPL